MYSVGTPLVTATDENANNSFEEVTRETILKREELQAAVIKHTNRIIDQMNGSLREMETIINQNLSPIHLRRIIDFIREDIDPLKSFVKRISTHAEQIGSLKKDHELRTTVFYNSMRETSYSSESGHSVASYLVRRNARQISPPLLLTQRYRPEHATLARSERLSPSDLSGDRRSRSRRKLSDVHEEPTPFSNRRQSRRHSREDLKSRYIASRSRSKSVYLTPEGSPQRYPERLWTPDAFKKSQPSRRKSKKSVKIGYDTRGVSGEDDECPTCHKDEVDDIANRLVGMKADLDDGMSDDELQYRLEKDKNKGAVKCQDIPSKDGVGERESPSKASVNAETRRPWYTRIRDSTSKLADSCHLGMLEMVILILLAYIFYQWWKGIIYRLGIVYRVYTGIETRGVPRM